MQRPALSNAFHSRTCAAYFRNMRKSISTLLLSCSLSSWAQDERPPFAPVLAGETPDWWSACTLVYALDDDRVEEPERIRYIGCLVPGRGTVLFVPTGEMIFPDASTEIKRDGPKVSKVLRNEHMAIQLEWNEEDRTGAYVDGRLTVAKEGRSHSIGPVYMVGW